MPKNIIFDDDKIINSNDYEAKCNEVINELDESLFKNLKPSVEIEVDLENDLDVKKKEYEKPKQSYSKNEILPRLTPMQVSAKLNELLRVYRPMSENEAKNMDDKDFLMALKWYMHLISYINKYLVFLPSKQSFSAFANITTTIYNSLLQDINFSSVFNSIEDYIVESNFTSSQAGIVDTKTTIDKLQMKDAGHNLVKNLNAISTINLMRLDKVEINNQLEKFESMTKQIGKGK